MVLYILIFKLLMRRRKDKSVGDQVSRLYKTTCKSVVLYIFIFKLLKRKWKNKRL